MMLSTSLLKVAKAEWRVWIPLSALAFVAASLLMSGWPSGLIPDTSVPYSYAGDGLAYLWNIQRALEGAWYFTNDRSGFPFGSNHLDYPTSDTGSYLIIKILGALFNSAIAAHNIYYLLGFSAAAFASYLVSRTLGISRLYAVIVAVLYAFTSFHFGRIGHLFFTWYFVAPLFFYVGFRLFSDKLLYLNPNISFKTKTINALGLLLLASFGIYYAFFGCIVILLSGILAAAVHHSWRRMLETMVTLGFVVLGVFLNVLPSLVYLFQQGENREGVNRFAAESELYALKITQLLLPRGDHRLDVFFEFASKYNNFFPIVTENISASMGAVGSLGLVLLFIVSIASPFLNFKSVDVSPALQTFYMHRRLQILAALSLGLILLGTMGGFSSLFAMLVSSSIRSWNRISIFIAFISVLAFALLADGLTRKYAKQGLMILVGYALAITVLVLGTLDQTVKPCHTCMKANGELAKNDEAFIQAIEKSLPQHAAIYQLPYMAYSDGGAANNLGSYDQARGHLHSMHLKWSFGGVRGRTGDWFYRKLALLPLNEQVAVVSAMGFAGIYIDKRGFIDVSAENTKKCDKFADSQIARLKNNCVTNAELALNIGNAPEISTQQGSLISKDQQLVFYPLKPYAPNPQTLTIANAYLLPTGFKLVNGIPVQLEGGFEETIDLRKDDPDMPVYLGGLTGLSGISIDNEGRVGRWSDKLFAKHVTIWLAKPLPKKFTLQIRAQAAGLNAGKPMQVKVGKQTKEIIFGSSFETKTVSFEIDEAVYKIEFKPVDPFSPARRWGYGDTGLIAVLFQKIQILPN
jgi:phosphoglycerol transferase